MEKFENIDEYIESLKAKLKKNPQCGNTHYNLGVAYLSRRDFMEAEREFLDAVANSPRMAEGYVQLGGIALQRGDLESCLSYNLQATQQRPFFSVPWGNIGFVQLQLGDTDKAHKSLKKALKLDPDFVQAQATMSSLQITIGDYEEADKLLKQILEKYPNFGPAWNNKSIIHASRQEWAEAAKCMAKAEENGFDVPDDFKKEVEANCQSWLPVRPGCGCETGKDDYGKGDRIGRSPFFMGRGRASAAAGGVMSRFRQVKRDLKSILAADDWRTRLGELDAWPPGILAPPLFSLRLDSDEAVRWRSVTAFGLVARRMAEASMEKARVLMRTCMWHMNEESGNLGWGIPHFMGEAMAQSEQIALEFHKILASYIFCDEACDGNFLDHPELRRDVLWGLGRLAEVRPELVAHGERFLLVALAESDPYNRAYAARVLGLIGAQTARAGLAALTGDATPIRTFRDGEMADTTVGALATEALAALG